MMLFMIIIIIMYFGTGLLVNLIDLYKFIFDRDNEK